MGQVDQFQNSIQSLSRSLDWIARGAILGVMGTFCGNIIMRVFGMPIIGAYEVVGFIGSIAISFALPYCTLKKGHICVELLMSRLPKRVQAIIGTITGVLSLCLFAVITWQSGAYATKMLQTGVITAALKVPLYPFMYGMVFGCSIMCLVLLLDVVQSAIKVVQK